jgi:alpha-2-macroglobulin
MAEPGTRVLVHPSLHELALNLRAPTSQDLLDCASGAPTSAPGEATVEPLDAAQVAQVLRKMEEGGAPPLVSPSDELDFAMRTKSLRPPRPGKIVKQLFPASDMGDARLLAEAAALEAAAVAATPLSVLRAGPTGDVSAVPQVSLSFSAPMVPLTQVEDSIVGVADTLGLQFTPASAGRWRWAGTQTLLFEPNSRLPAATTYEICVPKGATSAIGTSLAAEYRFQFSTPPPRLTQYSPGEYSRVREKPVLFAQFDQDMPPAAELLKYVSLSVTRGEQLGKVVQLRLVSTREALLAGLDKTDPRRAAERKTLCALWDAAVPLRHLFFAPVEPLPLASTLTVRVSVGTPSAEGP